jgi:hypothetical protein
VFTPFHKPPYPYLYGRSVDETTTPTLGTKREDFTAVNENGIPVEPKALAAGYGTQIGCIVWETMTINTRNLRDPGNAYLVQLLLQKLHERYDFPVEYKNLNLKDNKVNQQALTKMITALASWRTRVKKRIDKDESWEEIKKHEPLLDLLFKEELETDTFKALSALGKKMYEQNLGHHRLGSGGYRGIQEVWDKKDAELIRLGKPNMFDKFTDPQVRNFVRARYYLCPKTKEFKTLVNAMQEFEKLVVSNLPWISSRFAINNEPMILIGFMNPFAGS